MTRILVEHPIEEAEALLKRLGIEPLNPEEAQLAQAGRERLARAVSIERGPGGGAAKRVEPSEELAEAA